MKRYYSRYKPRSVRHWERKHQRNIIVSLILGSIILYLVFFWGLPNLIGGLSIFNRFKPSTSQDQPIEDSGLAPPVLNIPYEATNTATIKISGYASPNAQVKIYLDDNLSTSTQASDNGSFLTDPITLLLGTNLIYGQTVSDGKTSLASKTIKVIYSNEKPTIELLEPPDNHQITGGEKQVKVAGKTETANSVTVNGQTVILSPEGNFTTPVPLNDGDNLISIIATNSVGNTTRVERKVTFNP